MAWSFAESITATASLGIVATMNLQGEIYTAHWYIYVDSLRFSHGIFDFYDKIQFILNKTIILLSSSIITII